MLTTSSISSLSRRFIHVKEITPALAHPLPQVYSLQASKMPPTGAEYSRRSTSPYPLTAPPKFHRTVSTTDQPLPRRSCAQKTSDKESHLKCTSPALEIPTLGDLNPENPTPEKPGYAPSKECSVNCPYHGPVLQLLPSRNNPNNNFSAIDRFMKEDSSDQHALHIRPDTGQLSISKGCSCRDIPQDEVSALARLAIMELSRVCEENFIGIHDTAYTVKEE